MTLSLFFFIVDHIDSNFYVFIKTNDAKKKTHIRWMGICDTYHNSNRSMYIAWIAYVIGYSSFNHHCSISRNSFNCWYDHLFLFVYHHHTDDGMNINFCMQLHLFFVLYNKFIGLIGSLSIAVSFVISPITITFCRRKSTRLLAVIGGLILTLGCLFTSFAQQYPQVIFSYGKLDKSKDKFAEIVVYHCFVSLTMAQTRI